MTSWHMILTVYICVILHIQPFIVSSLAYSLRWVLLFRFCFWNGHLCPLVSLQVCTQGWLWTCAPALAPEIIGLYPRIQSCLNTFYHCQILFSANLHKLSIFNMKVKIENAPKPETFGSQTWSCPWKKLYLTISNRLQWKLEILIKLTLDCL